MLANVYKSIFMRDIYDASLRCTHMWLKFPSNKFAHRITADDPHEAAYMRID